jgi:hypothetical protein
MSLCSFMFCLFIIYPQRTSDNRHQKADAHHKETRDNSTATLNAMKDM